MPGAAHPVLVQAPLEWSDQLKNPALPPGYGVLALYDSPHPPPAPRPVPPAPSHPMPLLPGPSEGGAGLRNPPGKVSRQVAAAVLKLCVVFDEARGQAAQHAVIRGAVCRGRDG